MHISKTIGLSSSCVPPGLVSLPENVSYLVEDDVLRVRDNVLPPLLEMLDAAAADGYQIVVRSAYRGYQQQAGLFQYWVDLLGFDEAFRTSAPPGHSEHQLGTTVDLTSASNGYGLEGFENTAEAQWLAHNAYLFGFVVSYPPGSEQITGYVFEPWHFRYIGRTDARLLRDSGLTLHDFTAARR